MNHLAHFKLAEADDGLLVGNLLADHVKGRLTGNYNESVERGIQLHRAIDGYTDRHPLVRHSHRRFAPEFRRFGGIMTDIIFDHFLALHWTRYDHRPLAEFSRAITLRALQHPELPDGPARKQAQRLHESNAMARYTEADFVRRSFSYLGERLRFDNPLDRAFYEFEQYHDELEADFTVFYPELRRFAADWPHQQAAET